MTLAGSINLDIALAEVLAEDVAVTTKARFPSQSFTFNDTCVTWSDSRSFSSDDAIDLQSLPDSRGTVVLTSVHALWVRASDDTDGVVVNSDAGVVNHWSYAPTVRVPTSGTFMLVSTAEPFAVTSGQKVFELSSIGTTALYDIVIVGTGSIT